MSPLFFFLSMVVGFVAGFPLGMLFKGWSPFKEGFDAGMAEGLWLGKRSAVRLMRRFVLAATDENGELLAALNRRGEKG